MPFIIIPRRRRNKPTPKWLAAVFAIGFAGLAIFGVTQLSAEPTCSGHTMTPGDRCRYTKEGSSTVDHVNTYEQERADTHRNGLFMIGIGVLLSGGMTYELFKPRKVHYRPSAANARPAGGGSPMNSAYAAQIAGAARQFPTGPPPPPPAPPAAGQGGPLPFGPPAAAPPPGSAPGPAGPSPLHHDG